jgi:hypothetical protein
MRSVRAESGAAGIPAEVMQFISGIGHVHSTNNLAVLLGFRVYINDDQRVGLSTTVEQKMARRKEGASRGLKTNMALILW